MKPSVSSTASGRLVAVLDDQARMTPGHDRPVERRGDQGRAADGEQVRAAPFPDRGRRRSCSGPRRTRAAAPLVRQPPRPVIQRLVPGQRVVARRPASARGRRPPPAGSAANGSGAVRIQSVAPATRRARRVSVIRSTTSPTDLLGLQQVGDGLGVGEDRRVEGRPSSRGRPRQPRRGGDPGAGRGRPRSARSRTGRGRARTSGRGR